MDRPLHNKIFGSTDCLSEEQLLKYDSNTLSRKEKHKVEKHLIECELCTDALEGFAVVPAASEIYEIRNKVRMITSREKPASIANWKRFLLAASIIGVAFVSFYFIFQKNKLSEKEFLADNTRTEQTLPAEKPASGGEVASETLLENSNSSAADKLTVVNDESDREDIGSVNAETATAMISDNEIGAKQKDLEKGESIGDKKEEEKTLALAERSIQSGAQSTTSGEGKTVMKERNAQSLAQVVEADKNDISESSGYEESEAREKAGAESSLAGVIKVAPSKKANVRSKTSDLKYIQNHKVVDYSEEYTVVSTPPVGHIP
ncbi:MAG: hypothetical protein AAB221_06475, partial [Bacteroidota bacterium]